MRTLLAGGTGNLFFIKYRYAKDGGGSDGSSAECSLAIGGSTLYGTTEVGGTSNNGTVFRVNTDGTGFGVLHSFTGGSADGNDPSGGCSLDITGSVLYGTTFWGGNDNLGNGFGTVFKVGTDGSAFSLLHSFTSYPNDGSNANSSLAINGSTLYGMTSTGGQEKPGGGTVFKVNTDGSAYGLLHSFAGQPSDGEAPVGRLTVSGSTLYGVTDQGGANDFGTVFKVNMDGSGFSLLHSFTDGSNDGARPTGSLTLSGSTLYGMTYWGPGNGEGTVFAMNTDGTGFKLLHTFTGGSSDGRFPSGGLTLSGSTLYGATGSGGSAGDGTIFEINTDGSGFNVLHSFTGFAGGSNDGDQPVGTLTLSGSTLYGTTWLGGASNKGVVFSMEVPQPSAVPEPSTIVSLLGMSAIGLVVACLHRLGPGGGKRRVR